MTQNDSPEGTPAPSYADRITTSKAEARIRIRGTLTEGPDDLVNALATLTGIFSNDMPTEAWGDFQCVEIEALADVFRAIGSIEIADNLIQAHAYSDDDPGDQHHPAYAEEHPDHDCEAEGCFEEEGE